MNKQTAVQIARIINEADVYQIKMFVIGTEIFTRIKFPDGRCDYFPITVDLWLEDVKGA